MSGGWGEMNSAALAPRGPGELVRILEDLRKDLADVEASLQKADETAEQAEERWVEHYDSVMEVVEEDYNGKPMPASTSQEMRVSIARRRGGKDAWFNHRRAERAVRRLNKRAELIGEQIRAAQSEGRLLGIV